MKLSEIYDNLCDYDKRSPVYKDIIDCFLYEEDIPEPRQDCSCDNCFYGRDRLALEIIKLKGLIK